MPDTGTFLTALAKSWVGAATTPIQSFRSLSSAASMIGTHGTPMPITTPAETFENNAKLHSRSHVQ